MAMVPAKYIGPHAVKLRDSNGLDASGKPRPTAIIEPGDILLMPAEEVLGQSYLFDPHHIHEPLFLGVGKVIFEEHEQMTDEERAALGYEHHEGRADFEPLVSVPFTIIPRKTGGE